VRIGTPAVTSRGLVEKDMAKLAELVALAAGDKYEENIGYIRAEVERITQEYPLY